MSQKDIRGSENRFVRIEGASVRITVRVPHEYHKRLEDIAYEYNSTLTTVGGELLVMGLQRFEEEEKENALILEGLRKRLLALGLDENHVKTLISGFDDLDELEAMVKSLENRPTKNKRETPSVVD